MSWSAEALAHSTQTALVSERSNGRHAQHQGVVGGCCDPVVRTRAFGSSSTREGGFEDRVM